MVKTKYTVKLCVVESEDSIAEAIWKTLDEIEKDLRKQLNSELAHRRSLRKISPDWCGDSDDYIEMAQDQLKELKYIRKILKEVRPT